MSTLPNVNTAIPSAVPATKRGSREQYVLWLVLGLGSIVMLGPFYWMIVTSLKPQAEVLAFPPTWWPHQPTLQHWRGLSNLSVGSFSQFFRNSLFVTTTITLLTLLSSSMAGYVFAKLEFTGRDQLFWLVLSMIMIPFTVSIIPLYSLMTTLRWTNTYWAIIVPFVFDAFGIFLMRQFMFGIPNELIDAARIDGASEFRIFFQIILPLSQAALAALSIFVFLYHWDNFLWPLVVLNEPSRFTLPLGLAQFRGRVGTDIGGTAAGSIVAVLPVLVVYFAAQRRFIEGIALSGIKG